MSNKQHVEIIDEFNLISFIRDITPVLVVIGTGMIIGLTTVHFLNNLPKVSFGFLYETRQCQPNK